MASPEAFCLSLTPGNFDGALTTALDCDEHSLLHHFNAGIEEVATGTGYKDVWERRRTVDEVSYNGSSS